ncbi:hypothetical protein BGZ70_008316 [Mortierella alpina]|uniref:Uncharacterized protein n=1 Tax=Mortierella alpina TaxID=64518 RepID=A0A9P6JFT1_MORAP|nr:hypothetical protein BGZ70_008316 [Mortierella alpina]
MSSILNVLRSAPTPTRHFTSLQVVSSAKTQSSAFNPEHHPIVLQQLVESLSPKAFVASAKTSSTGVSAAVKDSLSGKTTTAGKSASQQLASQGQAIPHA